MSATTAPAFRYLAAQVAQPFLPAIGQVIDTSAPEWLQAAATAGIKVAGRYRVEAHSIKASNADSVKLQAADAITAARLKLAAAEKKLANLSNPAWLAAESVKAQAAIAEAQAVVNGLAVPRTATVAEVLAAPAPVAQAAPVAQPDLAAMIAQAVAAAMAQAQA